MEFKFGEHYQFNMNKKYKTHTKNYQFIFHDKDGNIEYVTITGSTNGKDDAYKTKANNQLVITEIIDDIPLGETLPPIYEAHKILFDDIFTDIVLQSPIYEAPKTLFMIY